MDRRLAGLHRPLPIDRIGNLGAQVGFWHILDGADHDGAALKRALK